jgi:hypothetical protein
VRMRFAGARQHAAAPASPAEAKPVAAID